MGFDLWWAVRGYSHEMAFGPKTGEELEPGRGHTGCLDIGKMNDS